MEDDPVRCLKCGSTQIHAGKRGWNVLAGVFGMNKVIITCLKCGHTFKPGGEVNRLAELKRRLGLQE